MSIDAIREAAFLREMFLRNQQAVSEYVEKQKESLEKVVNATKQMNSFKFKDLAIELKNNNVSSESIDNMLKIYSEASETLFKASLEQREAFNEFSEEISRIKDDLEERSQSLKSPRKSKNISESARALNEELNSAED